MVLMMFPHVKDGTMVLMMVPHVKDGTDGSDDGSSC